MTDAAQRPSGEMRVSRVVFGLGNVIWIAVQYISPLPSTTVDIIYVFICKGAETTCSVPLRYHQLTTTNFVVRDDETTTTYHECRHPLSGHLMEAKRSFIPRKWRRQTSSSTKYHIQAICTHFTSCLFVFLSLSNIINIILFKHVPKNIPKTLL